MWASNLRGKDTSLLISHVKCLLSIVQCNYWVSPNTDKAVAEPGGFIQWEDAELVHQLAEGAKAEEFESSMNEIFEKAGLDYR